jgi:hypothetical protein
LKGNIGIFINPNPYSIARLSLLFTVASSFHLSLHSSHCFAAGWFLSQSHWFLFTLALFLTFSYLLCYAMFLYSSFSVSLIYLSSMFCFYSFLYFFYFLGFYPLHKLLTSNFVLNLFICLAFKTLIFSFSLFV